MKLNKYIVGILLSSESLFAMAQKSPIDTSGWMNYNRQSEKPFFKAEKSWNKEWIYGRDTTSLTYHYSSYRDHGPVLYQTLSVNSDGIDVMIGYYPNGIVRSVDFYRNEIPWQAISLSDTTGKPHNPGTLKDGNGVKSFMSSDGSDLGFESFKNGHQDGLYLHKDVYGLTAISGFVKYCPSCVNYLPAYKVTVVMGTDTIKETFDKPAYAAFFADTALFKVLSLKPDSVKEEGPAYLDHSEFFRETENVPVGIWRYFDVRSNKTLVEFEYDDCGNEMNRTYFNADGSISGKKIYQKMKLNRRISIIKQ